MILNLVSKELGISILPYSFKSANIENVEFIELDVKIDLYANWRKNELNKTVSNVVGYAERIAETI